MCLVKLKVLAVSQGYIPILDSYILVEFQFFHRVSGVGLLIAQPDDLSDIWISMSIIYFDTQILSILFFVMKIWKTGKFSESPKP